MFQSLFSWNLLLMLTKWKHIEQWTHVSILVFVELALDVLRDDDIYFLNVVSILVFVELALDESRPII